LLLFCVEIFGASLCFQLVGLLRVFTPEIIALLIRASVDRPRDN
jgi:hypothetical protein